MNNWLKYIKTKTLVLSFSILAVIVIFLLILLPDKKRIIQEEFRRERMADVSHLTQMYFKVAKSSNINVDIKTLEQQISNNGERLLNPLAVRKDKSCYELIYPAVVMLENGKEQILVIAENDNVNSEDVAVSTATGFVFIMDRKKFKDSVRLPHGDGGKSQTDLGRSNKER